MPARNHSKGRSGALYLSQSLRGSHGMTIGPNPWVGPCSGIGNLGIDFPANLPTPWFSPKHHLFSHRVLVRAWGVFPGGPAGDDWQGCKCYGIPPLIAPPTTEHGVLAYTAWRKPRSRPQGPISAERGGLLGPARSSPRTRERPPSPHGCRPRRRRSKLAWESHARRDAHGERRDGTPHSPPRRTHTPAVLYDLSRYIAGHLT